jgi:hypothetical protein
MKDKSGELPVRLVLHMHDERYIKPSVDEMGQDVILGTAMDMTGVFPRRFNPKQIRQEENKNVKIVM